MQFLTKLGGTCWFLICLYVVRFKKFDFSPNKCPSLDSLLQVALVAKARLIATRSAFGHGLRRTDKHYGIADKNFVISDSSPARGTAPTTRSPTIVSFEVFPITKLGVPLMPRAAASAVSLPIVPCLNQTFFEGLHVQV